MKLIEIGIKMKEAFWENGIKEGNQFIPNRRDDDSFFIKQSVFDSLQKEFLKHKDADAHDLSYGIMSGIEVISFKKSGNCFTNGGICYKRYDDKIVTVLAHNVTLIGGYVIDFGTGINGMPISKYLEALYELNNRENIRIDYTMSSFMSANDEDGLTDAMCSFLKTREGLPYNTFINLWESAKKITKMRDANNSIAEAYDKLLSEFHDKFKDSKRGINVIKGLYKEGFSMHNLSISVLGSVNLLCADGSMKSHSQFDVLVTDDFYVLDPAHGWKALPVDVWLSMVAICNPSQKEHKILNKSTYDLRFSNQCITEFLELSTYGDLDFIKGEGNSILSKCYKEHLSILLDCIEKVRCLDKLDLSCLISLFVTGLDSEQTKRITKLSERAMKLIEGK